MRRQRGFTYLGVILAIAIMGIGLTTASEIWATMARRQRMEQLDWVGQQYVQAIGSYYEAMPGRVKMYPRNLSDLVEDKRFVFTRRHLRQVYINPFTAMADWQVITAPDGGIRGLRFQLAASTSVATEAREFVYRPAP